MSGRLSRTSGHNFERKIAKILRERFPEHAGAIIRGSQGDQAHAPDVVFPGWWIECQCAARPTPAAKFNQALEDVAREQSGRIPVVVYTKKGSGVITCVMMLDHFSNLTCGRLPECAQWGGALVSVAFETWLELAAFDMRHTHHLG